MAELSEQEKKKLIKEYLESLTKGKMPTDPNQMRSYFGAGETSLPTPTSSKTLMKEIAKSDKPNPRPSFEELIKMEGAPERLKKLSATMEGIYSPIFEQNSKAPAPTPAPAPLSNSPTPAPTPLSNSQQKTIRELIAAGEANKDQLQNYRNFPSLRGETNKPTEQQMQIAKRLEGTVDPAKDVLSQREKIARIRSNFANKRQADFEAQKAKSRQFIDEILDDPRRSGFGYSTPSGEGRTINRILTGDPSGRRDIRSAAAQQSERDRGRFFKDRKERREKRREKRREERVVEGGRNNKPRYGYGA